MNGATLKTIREALGLPVPWLAMRASVRERTIRYWESNRFVVPADVATLIEGLESVAQQMVDQSVAIISQQISDKSAGTALHFLVRYEDDEDLAHYRTELAGLPVTYHAAVLARVRWALADMADIVIGTLDAGAYEAWRRANGAADSPALRAKFVSFASEPKRGERENI